MSEQVEQEARTMGWVPQENFRGDPNKWVDAETFVERGHTVMPILKANNKRLEGELQKTSAEVQRLSQLFAASQESIQELQKVHTDATKAAVEKAKRDLLSELKSAKENGDVELEIQLTDQLTDLKAQQQAAAAYTPPPPAPSQPQGDAMHPDFAGWMQDNPWFGVDQRRTQKAMGIAQVLRSDPGNDNLTGRDFYDRILQEMDGAPARNTSKVEGSRPSGRSDSGAGGRAFSDLPADAKEACDRQARKVVGEGRAFKDMDSWRKYYTKLYNEGN